VKTFGDDSVFMDVAGINPGIDFRKAIDDNVATCGVLLAMIGPGWTTVTGDSGERRLDDANDFVRLEVASALARNIAVIPVLVHGAKMPRPELLPDNLKDLAFRNSVEITHARWNSDVQLLTKALAQYVTSSSATSTEPVHATVAVQLPPPNPPAGETAPASRSRMPLIAGGAAVILLLGVAAFFFFHNSSGAVPVVNGPTPTQPATDTSSAGNSQAPDWAKPLIGTWTGNGGNAKSGTAEDSAPSRKENELARLKVVSKGDEVKIHAWGLCRKCDWGTQPVAVESGNRATATWDFTKLTDIGEPDSGRVARVTIIREGDKLVVTVQNTYSNRGPSNRKSQFDRAD
jgi:hypothetical protein